MFLKAHWLVSFTSSTMGLSESYYVCCQKLLDAEKAYSITEKDFFIFNVCGNKFKRPLFNFVDLYLPKYLFVRTSWLSELSNGKNSTQNGWSGSEPKTSRIRGSSIITLATLLG